MADKIIKITLDQLNDIVSDAVTNAIKKLDNVEIIEDTPKESSSIVSVGEFSDEQYKEAIETMARNRGAGDEPKVGIFWYNATLKQLFGVVTHKRTDYRLCSPIDRGLSAFYQLQPDRECKLSKNSGYKAHYKCDCQY